MKNYSIQVHSKTLNAWESAEEIAIRGNQERSFYICDINDLISKFNTWKRLMPRIRPFYAIKCNNDPVVLKVLAALGLGFDCASKSEIQQILSLGVRPEQIVYANPTKVTYHIKYASSVQVNLMTFDSEMELDKMKELHSNPQAIIRIRHDDQEAKSILGIKFGCNPYTEALNLLQKAKEMEIDVVGVSFHVGSGCKNPIAFGGAIADARYVFDVAKNIGLNFKILDIGGGYSGKLDGSIEKFAAVINSSLEKYFLNDEIQIISEPGTYFVESAFTLACRIHSIREITTENVTDAGVTKSYMYYIDDGVYGSFSTVISWDSIFVPIPLKKPNNSEKYISSIWGPTSDSIDRIAENVLLPKLDYKDWVVFFNMGAYTLSILTPFNNLDHPEVYYIINDENCKLLKNILTFEIQTEIKT